MKKTLIALAALAAAGASFAQSSVTLYGVADLAVGKVNKAVSGSVLGLGNDKFQAIASNTLNNGTSRFGLKGVEDLGGGLKAGFNLEGGLSLADGSGNKSGGQLFSRAANMSLMGGFGEIRGGRTLTTSLYSIASWELTGITNYSVVGNQFGYNGFDARNSAVVMYNSPDFSGFSFSASTVLKGNSGIGKDVPNGKYDLAATYANGPITASLAYARAQDFAKSYTLGGKYNFGPAAVAASVTKKTGLSATNSGVTLAKGYTLGVSGIVGVVSLTFDYARDSEYKDSDYLLEAKYPLSKRTFAYAVYYRDGKNNRPQGDLKRLTESVNGYSLGLRHNF